MQLLHNAAAGLHCPPSLLESKASVPAGNVEAGMTGKVCMCIRMHATGTQEGK